MEEMELGRFVVRDGKWVSEDETNTMLGELCVVLSDGCQYFRFELGCISNGANIILADDADQQTIDAKHTDFDKCLIDLGLPEFFREEKE